ncbi:MAG: hypothetical protein J1E39_06645, partial [Eubacterium sp.]|nr:hypothetical protein [Eubacterium sp.]
APETEAPETEAPETEAPETEAPAPGVSGDVEPDGSDNPETGVALAVAPVALAAAALAAAGVATKKRK